jgi:hypothetical protein
MIAIAASIAAGAVLANEHQPEPESTAVEPQFQFVYSSAECRAKFSEYLEVFGYNPFSMEGYEDPRPIEIGAPEVLIKNILNATREWVIEERFDRCVSAVCACILRVPEQGYAVHVSDCEEYPGVLNHAVAMIYLSDPDLKRINVIKWYKYCSQPPDPDSGQSDGHDGGTTSNNTLNLPVRPVTPLAAGQERASIQLSKNASPY